MNNDRNVTIALIALALVALTVVIGGVALALNDKALPGELIAIGSGAAGAIAGVVAIRKTTA